MEYVKIHDLPLPKGHENGERVGCIICPKAGFKRNVKILFKYPKLINAVLKTALRDRQNFIIREKDLSDDKILYVCLWLNSFHSFSKKEEKLYNAFRRYYEKRFGTNSN